MSCGCPEPVVPDKARAAMCLTCGSRRGWECARSGLTVHLHVLGRAECPVGRFPDERGRVRWWGVFTDGVPKATRWWIRLRWGVRFQGAGCGCFTALKRAWARITGNIDPT
jgi:hypothetical protein